MPSWKLNEQNAKLFVVNLVNSAEVIFYSGGLREHTYSEQTQYMSQNTF